MRKRPIKLSVRVNQMEYQYLTLQADASGLSKEAFIRKRIMGEPIKTRPPQELPELLRLLKSASDNINQIARATNARHFIRSEELDEIYSRLDDIWSKVKEL